MRILLAAILLSQSVPLGPREIEAGLKKFGDRTYKIMEKGSPVGTCTLKTRIALEDGRRLAIFEDKIEAKSGETPLEFVEKASLKDLSLLWATRADGGIKEDDPAISIEDGDAHVTSEQGNMKLTKVAGALGERALIRAVCMQKQEVGNAIKTNLLVLDPVDYQRDQEIKCVARETIEVKGRKVEVYRWEDRREGQSVLSGQPISYKFDNKYWVGADGALLRIKAGPLEMVFDSK